jgi:hypothetical protein
VGAAPDRVGGVALPPKIRVARLAPLISLAQLYQFAEKSE